MRMRIPNARHYEHDRATPLPKRNEYQRDALSAWQPKIYTCGDSTVYKHNLRQLLLAKLIDG